MVIAVSALLPSGGPSPIDAEDPADGECQEQLLATRPRPASTASCPSPGPLEAAAALPAGFSEIDRAHGLANPTNVEFAADGRVFVAEKSGVIKVFDSLTDSTPTAFSDLVTTSTTSGTGGSSGSRSTQASPTRRCRRGRGSTCCTPTTTSSVARGPSAATMTAVRPHPAPPPTAAWSAPGCHASTSAGARSRAPRRSSSKTGASSTRATRSGRSGSAVMARCMPAPATGRASTRSTTASSAERSPGPRRRKTHAPTRRATG